jgi:hypothetical protein
MNVGRCENNNNNNNNNQKQKFNNKNNQQVNQHKFETHGCTARRQRNMRRAARFFMRE